MRPPGNNVRLPRALPDLLRPGKVRGGGPPGRAAGAAAVATITAGAAAAAAAARGQQHRGPEQRDAARRAPVLHLSTKHLLACPFRAARFPPPRALPLSNRAGLVGQPGEPRRGAAHAVCRCWFLLVLPGD